MINVCLDTNVLLDYLLERPDNDELAKQIITAGSKGSIRIYTSSSSLLTCLYFLQRFKFPSSDIAFAISGLLQFITIVNSSNKAFISGLNAGFADLEDGIQYYTALSNESIQLFITRNLKDYKRALPQLKVLSPTQFIKQYGPWETNI